MSDIPVIAEGHNLIPNPSFEDDTGGFTNVIGTITVENPGLGSEWAFAGKRSSVRRISGTGTGSFQQGIASSTTYTAQIEAGKTYSGSAACITFSTGLSGTLEFIFRDEGGTIISTVSGTSVELVANAPNILRLQAVEAPVGATRCQPVVHFARATGSWAVGDRTHVDAFQLNEGITVDHYIDGEQGEHYEWVGTPYRSPSIRRAFQIVGPTGTGGVIDVRVRVYKTTRQNDLGEEITPFVLGGSWNWDIDRDGPKTLVRLTIDGANVIQPMEWVAIFLDVFYENGTTESGQLGIYRMELPDRRYAGESVEVEAAGFDPIILLDDRTLETNVTLAAGTNIVSTIRTYLNQVGVRHSIPNRSNVISSAGASWKVHTKWSTFLNELAAMAGLYALHTNDKGQITSKPVIASLADEQASHKYTIGRNSKLIGDILFKPNGSSIFNRVVVARDDPAQGAILTAVRSFSDPASGYSTVNMGVKTRAYSMQNAATQDVINAYADARIQELSLFMYGELKIIPTPFHTPYEVIDLDFEGNTENPVLAEHSGKYYVKGVSFDLMSTEGTMGLSIRRTERFDNV